MFESPGFWGDYYCITQARPRRKKAGAEHPDLEGADGKSGVRLVQQ